MRTLYRLTDLPFVPADRVGRLRDQIAMLREGSQRSTLEDLEKRGLMQTRKVLEMHPLTDF